MSEAVQVISLEELGRFDGRGANPAYIAINGTVYDITGVNLLKDGKHHGVNAGKDVSKLFVHKVNILNRLKVVGRLGD